VGASTRNPPVVCYKLVPATVRRDTCDILLHGSVNKQFSAELKRVNKSSLQPAASNHAITPNAVRRVLPVICAQWRPVAIRTVWCQR